METYLDIQLRLFRSLDIECTLVTTSGLTSDYYDSLVRDGVTVRAVIEAKSDRYTNQWYKQIVPELSLHAGSVLIFHGLAGARWYGSSSAKKITITHGSFPLSILNTGLDAGRVKSVMSRLRAYIRRMEPVAFRSHVLVALSSYDARLTDLAYFRRRRATRVIPPYVEPATGRSARLNEIVFAGRLIESKGVLEVIRAWREVGDESHVLRIIGDGPLYEEVLELEDRSILAVGAKSNHDVRSAFAAARWVVCAGSIRESFGLAAAEALASGTPVIYPRRGALPETVGTAGLSYEDGLLADILRVAIRMDDLEWSSLSSKSIERAASFDRESYLNRWTRLLEEV